MEQAIVVGFLGTRIDWLVHNIGKLGMALQAHAKVVPVPKVFGRVHARRNGAGDGRSSLLCIPADPSELSHCPLYLACGNGTKYFMLVTQPQIVSAKVLASGLYVLHRQGLLHFQKMMCENKRAKVMNFKTAIFKKKKLKTIKPNQKKNYYYET